MNFKIQKLVVFAIVFLSFKSINSNAQVVPQYFVDQVYLGGWNNLRGFTFDNNKNMYAWEKGGKVWIVDSNGIKLPNPLIDISEEVGDFGENGLTGFALDPDFTNNGLIYLYYTVDRYYLLNFGTPGYDASLSTPNEATICRLTRYTCNPSTNFTSVYSWSRLILLGDNKKNGVPVLFESQVGGSIVFGSDGSLLLSTGDAASNATRDSGSVADTYWQQALADSIIRPAENVGSFRALLVNCLNGKILRMYGNSGYGISSNPFYNASAPQSPQSLIYALGLRNPTKFTIIPGTGSTDVNVGNPGVIYLGDAGFNSWESLDVIKQSGANYGWPLYEGLTFEGGFMAIAPNNLDAPNPLNGIGNCNQPYFNFNDLIINDHNPQITFFPNPCDTSQSIPSLAFPLNHRRPALEWKHKKDTTRCPGYTNGSGVAISIMLNQLNSPVQGDMFKGEYSVGGTFFEGISYPVQYQNSYYHGDAHEGWIKRFTLDSGNNIIAVEAFADSIGQVVHIGVNPRTDCLMYIKYPDEIHQICYNPAAGINEQINDLNSLMAEVRPNPVEVNKQANVFVKSQNSQSENYNVQIFNSIGKLVFEGNFSAINANMGTYIPISTPLTTGIYLLKVCNGTYQAMNKFVKK